MKINNPILITHNDLDGVGAEILFRKAFGKDSEVFMCGYNDVNKVVLEVMNNKGFNDSIVFITDLSVSEEIAEIIQSYHQNRVLLLDHHKTADWLNKYSWADVVDEFCGTKLLWFVLKEDYGCTELLNYEDFVDLVNDYDLWIHKDKKSKQINTLYSILGRKSFVERWLNNPSTSLSHQELRLLDIEEQRKKKYIDKKLENAMLKKMKDGATFGIVYAEQYISELGHEMLNQLDIDCAMIIDMALSKVSLRSTKNYDCSIFAKEKGGGGHPQASGYQIDKDDIKKATELIW